MKQIFLKNKNIYSKEDNYFPKEEEYDSIDGRRDILFSATNEDSNIDKLEERKEKEEE